MSEFIQRNGGRNNKETIDGNAALINFLCFGRRGIIPAEKQESKSESETQPGSNLLKKD